MVEVIEYGKRAMRCRCSECDSLLQYCKDDTQTYWGRYTGYYQAIKCPVCNKIVPVGYR